MPGIHQIFKLRQIPYCKKVSDYPLVHGLQFRGDEFQVILGHFLGPFNRNSGMNILGVSRADRNSRDSDCQKDENQFSAQTCQHNSICFLL